MKLKQLSHLGKIKTTETTKNLCYIELNTLLEIYTDQLSNLKHNKKRKI